MHIKTTIVRATQKVRAGDVPVISCNFMHNIMKNRNRLMIMCTAWSQDSLFYSGSFSSIDCLNNLEIIFAEHSSSRTLISAG